MNQRQGWICKRKESCKHPLKNFLEISTVITVAHRLHTIKNADKILYVENGELLAAGRHNELLESVVSISGEYGLLYSGEVCGYNERPEEWSLKLLFIEKKDILLSIFCGFIAGIIAVALFSASGYLISKAGTCFRQFLHVDDSCCLCKDARYHFCIKQVWGKVFFASWHIYNAK